MIGVKMSYSEAQLVIIVGLLVYLVDAQTSGGGGGGGFNDNPYNFGQFNPPIASILIALVAALFFMGICSIYLRRCNDAPVSVGSIRRGLSMRNRRGAAARGLDHEIIVSLPTLPYSEVKEHKIGKGALECAVCLNEFVEDDTLRLLPHCDHVFHPECIGAWLAHHTTCPVCRADLTQPAQATPLKPPENNQISSRTDEIAIQIDETQSSTANPAPNSETLNRIPNFRSHSTGHSLVLLGENLDRFTLRLPEGMKKEVIERSLFNRARSYASGSAPGFRTDGVEDSSRCGARSSQRVPERWGIFRRAFSMKSPKVASNSGGERSSHRNTSFKCLEPKAAETAEISNGAATPHV